MGLSSCSQGLMGRISRGVSGAGASLPERNRPAIKAADLNSGGSAGSKKGLVVMSPGLGTVDFHGSG